MFADVPIFLYVGDQCFLNPPPPSHPCTFWRIISFLSNSVDCGWKKPKNYKHQYRTMIFSFLLYLKRGCLYTDKLKKIEDNKDCFDFHGVLCNCDCNCAFLDFSPCFILQTIT